MAAMAIVFHDEGADTDIAVQAKSGTLNTVVDRIYINLKEAGTLELHWGLNASPTRILSFTGDANSGVTLDVGSYYAPAKANADLYISSDADFNATVWGAVGV